MLFFIFFLAFISLNTLADEVHINKEYIDKVISTDLSTFLLPSKVANPSRSLITFEQCPICSTTFLCDTCNIPLIGYIQIRNAGFESRALWAFNLATIPTGNLTTCSLKLGNLLNKDSNIPPSSSQVTVALAQQDFNPSTITWGTMPPLGAILGSIDILTNTALDLTNSCKDAISKNSQLYLYVLPTVLGPQQLYYSNSELDEARIVIT